MSAVCLKFCPLRPKFVKSLQTIRTCRALARTEILSKQTNFLLLCNYKPHIRCAEKKYLNTLLVKSIFVDP